MSLLKKALLRTINFHITDKKHIAKTKSSKAFLIKLKGPTWTTLKCTNFEVLENSEFPRELQVLESYCKSTMDDDDVFTGRLIAGYSTYSKRNSPTRFSTSISYIIRTCLFSIFELF